MSGGSYKYAYIHLEDFAEALQSYGCCYAAPPFLRQRFAKHCALVARAMRACEWNDSGDDDRDEERLICEVLQIKAPVGCGHDASAVVSSDEGTSYCRECEREAMDPRKPYTPSVG